MLVSYLSAGFGDANASLERRRGEMINEHQIPREGTLSCALDIYGAIHIHNYVI